MLLNMVSPGRRTVKFDDSAVAVLLWTPTNRSGCLLLDCVNGPPGCIVRRRKLAGKCFLLPSSGARLRRRMADNVHKRRRDGPSSRPVNRVPHAGTCV